MVIMRFICDGHGCVVLLGQLASIFRAIREGWCERRCQNRDTVGFDVIRLVFWCHMCVSIPIVLLFYGFQFMLNLIINTYLYLSDLLGSIRSNSFKTAFYYDEINLHIPRELEKA